MKKILTLSALALFSFTFASNNEFKINLEKSTIESVNDGSKVSQKNISLLRFLEVTFTSVSCNGPVTVVFETNAAEGTSEFIDDLSFAVNYADLHHCYGDGADSFLLLK